LVPQPRPKSENLSMLYCSAVRRSFGLFCQSWSLFNSGTTLAVLICATN
jgi:hypothetical protein